MWTSKMFKTRAREELSGHWMRTVGAVLLASILGIVPSIPVYLSDISDMLVKHGNVATADTFLRISVYLSPIVIIYAIFVMGPIRTGFNLYFMKSAEERTVGDLFTFFRTGDFYRIGGKMFLLGLQIFLWSLLFVIPGIIKSYQYYWVGYLFAQNPDMSLKEAKAISRKMTAGEKFKIFLFELSFIGWALLSVVTLGIGMLWVEAYRNQATAKLYLFRRGEDTPGDPM